MTVQRSLVLGALCLGCAFRGSRGQLALTPAQLCARRDSLMAQIPAASNDDVYEVAARLLPGGFGGLTTTYMFLKQPALADTARGLARTMASCAGDSTWNRIWEIASRVEVRPGQYDWIELRRWYASRHFEAVPQYSAFRQPRSYSKLKPASGGRFTEPAYSVSTAVEAALPPTAHEAT